ncbi:hypothetical protein QC761_0110540 [Podospora bellae-mahoneyi]|uniref:Uncharacterized protein n=1 Tax=Podospora bellae-mahoneyi TaxID=2093777 RepID=A0ABR0F9C6_9PEZI|nr:hypothetical protein QC761_0110540 [Podospora bellae-mahoneyi]
MILGKMEFSGCIWLGVEDFFRSEKVRDEGFTFVYILDTATVVSIGNPNANDNTCPYSPFSALSPNT